MKKLSIFDRKFLASCNVRVEGQRRWSDAIFLQSCGISTTLTPEEFQSANKHRDISPCRGCGVLTFGQHTKDCPDRALDGTEQLDGTQQLLVECGLDPYNRTDYLLLAFAGNPPAELDGEIEAMLPEEFQTDFDEDEDEED
jgi:hypothetical protein